MKCPSILTKLFQHIDGKQSTYIDRLSQAIALHSITSSGSHENDIRKMVDWITAQLQNIGFHVTVRYLNAKEIKDPQVSQYWPIIFADLGNNPSKKTVLIWSNLDVKFSGSKLWKSDPFKLSLREGKLYGKGAAYNKSAILCWLHAIEAYQNISEALPVNIKFMLDFFQENYEQRIKEAEEQLVIYEKDHFFHNIDYICISAGYSLDKNQPCIIYSVKGVMNFCLKIKCANRDLHSGLFGGAVYEGLPDLLYLLNSLTDKNGMLIDDIHKQVTSIDLDSIRRFAKLDVNFQNLKQVTGVKKLPHSENKVEFLTRWWKTPSLFIHGIEGASCDEFDKLTIPSCVTGKFSIRVVPHQSIEETKRVILKHLYDKWSERNGFNQLQIDMNYAISAWTANLHDHHITAAMHASEYVYNKTPSLICESSPVPMASCLHNILNKSLVVIPICSINCDAHCANEFIEVESYMKGIKVFGAYLYAVSKLKQSTTK